MLPRTRSGVLLASLPLSTRWQLSIQGCDPDRGDPHRCTPSPSSNRSWAALCLDSDHRAFSRLQGRKALSRGKSQGTEGGCRPSLQPAFTNSSSPSRCQEGFGVVAQPPSCAGSPEAKSGVRSRPCIYRTSHRSLENTRFFPFLLSLPTSFVSSPCQGLGSIRNSPEWGWVAGHGGLTPSHGRWCAWVGAPTSPRLLALGTLGRERRMSTAVPLHRSLPRAAAGHEATAALSARQRSMAVGS